MGGALGSLRDATVTAHLLADLSKEARAAWADLAPSRVVADRRSSLHERLHTQLARVGRRLRTAKPGIPVHAACCRLEDGTGVLIAGTTGAGKSTLATALGTRVGATVIADDTVWLDGALASGIGAPLALRAGSPFWNDARALWYAEDGARLLVRPDDLGMARVATSTSVDRLLIARYGRSDASGRVVTAAECFCHLVGSLLRIATEHEIAIIAELACAVVGAEISYADIPTSVELSTQMAQVTRREPPVSPRHLGQAEVENAGLCADVRGIRFGAEVVLWRPPSADVVHVRDWPTGSLWETSAQEALRGFGFLEEKETRRAGYAPP